ncbi:hypothetical protein ACIA59_20040 [Micromonospora haikouensis]|uniref:hypothetical protein n=1 Tax=Micromonospora haikouensis TaxID=686309 RepID=UPI0037954D90
MSLTTAGMASAYEHYFGVALAVGAYAILAAGVVIGGCGWAFCCVVGRTERRIRRELANERQDILDRLDWLTGQVSGMSAALVAQQGVRASGRATGQLYVSRVAGPNPVDADTIGLPSGGLRVAGTEVDASEAARVQWYAEGYVDGIARRIQGPPGD